MKKYRSFLSRICFVALGYSLMGVSGCEPLAGLTKEHTFDVAIAFPDDAYREETTCSEPTFETVIPDFGFTDVDETTCAAPIEGTSFEMVVQDFGAEYPPIDEVTCAPEPLSTVVPTITTTTTETGL